MSDSTKPPHQSDPGTHAEPDESQTTPAARIMFGWTSKPWAPRAIFIALVVISVILIALEPLLEMMSGEGHHFRHTYFDIDGLTAFHAWWGFGSFALVVLAGWPLGRLMRRSEDYYDDEAEPAGEEPHP